MARWTRGAAWDGMASLILLLAGTIGFLATYWAVRRLYGAIRVD